MKVLDLTKSTYCSPFNRLCKEVSAACDEANDNVRYLKTLQPTLEKLISGSMGDATSFQELTESFRPTVHLIMLIWKHSKYYNTPARLVVLMREICNDLISQARVFVSPEQLFEIEAQEAVERLMITLKVCGTFKSVYFDYKSRANNEVPTPPQHTPPQHNPPQHNPPQHNPLQHTLSQHMPSQRAPSQRVAPQPTPQPLLPTLPPPTTTTHRAPPSRSERGRTARRWQVPQNPWRIQNTALFPRLDAFLERCHDLLDLCKTVVQFQRLERIEIGGNKGRTLSASVGQIYTDFTNVLDAFVKVPYDVLDVEVKQFDDDFYEVNHATTPPHPTHPPLALSSSHVRTLARSTLWDEPRRGTSHHASGRHGGDGSAC
jgi:hypothetical protein